MNKAARAPAKRASRAKKPSPMHAATSIWKDRVTIETVLPEVDCGRAAVKRVLGDALAVSADVFSDGHDVIRANVLWRHESDAAFQDSALTKVENDRWAGSFRPDRIGRWFYAIEAWRDPYATWVSDTRKKLAADQPLALEAEEGAALLLLASVKDDRLSEYKTILESVAAASVAARVDILLRDDVVALMERYGPRSSVSRYPVEFPLWVDRPAARFASWYELFPRSQSPERGRHGTFRDVIARLPYVRDLGFDVLYFPPIHPVGRTNRKGRNNALVAQDADPGSVYAIGAAEGGHDAVHPELGTIEDFRALVAEAASQGIEIALDLAIQCSPDHPWIAQHPDWFERRPDGSIRYAENPPKKYEDIVNLDMEREDVRDALRDVVRFWIDQGVAIFRVDNPHTKPVPFWEWLIADINRDHPNVLFLAEAFTRPKMMRKLAKVGFQQSYTYFTWRNTKQELIDYVTELMGPMGEYYRPNFFVNTPDINPYYLQTSGRAGFIVRSTLAATLSSLWGMYSGFEICEAAPLPGREEYADSEKYELKHRDLSSPGNIAGHIRALNRIRREHAALQDFRNTVFLNAWNDEVLAFARMSPARDECVFVMVNLDPHSAQTCSYEIPLWEFDLPDWERLAASDLLRGNSFFLEGKTHVITLDPASDPVVIWRLAPPSAGRGPR